MRISSVDRDVAFGMSYFLGYVWCVCVILEKNMYVLILSLTKREREREREMYLYGIKDDLLV